MLPLPWALRNRGTSARDGETVEADSGGKRLGHHFGGVLVVLAGGAGDETGVLADHGFHRFDAPHVAGLVHQPIGLLIKASHCMFDLPDAIQTSPMSRSLSICGVHFAAVSMKCLMVTPREGAGRVKRRVLEPCCKLTVTGRDSSQWPMV